MKLIILLVVLGLERYLGVGEKLRRFSWFNAYLDRVNDILGKQSWFSGLGGAIVTILPIPLIATIVCIILSVLLGHEMHALIWLVLSIFILLYCLGPQDLYQQVQSYAGKEAKSSSATSSEIENQLLDGASIAEPHAVTKSIFWEANQCLFGVFFWFMILGIFGALLYRCTALLRQATNQPDSPFAAQAVSAQQIQNVLDWIPVRIFSLFFALVGQFNASFTFWLENIISGLNNTRRFISEAGLIALGSIKPEKGEAHSAEYYAALSLIDRSLIIFLAIVALFTLGSWVY